MPVDTIISTPNLEKLEARIDMRQNYVTMIIDGMDVQLTLEYEEEKILLQRCHDDTDREDFTSSDDDIASTSLNESEDKEAFVVTIRDKQRTENNGYQEVQTVERLVQKLGHILQDFQERSREVFEKHSVISHSLKDVNQSDTTVTYFLKPTDNTAIADRNRRLSLSHNEIVRAVLMMILGTRISTTAVLAWSFPVAIISRNEGTPRFSVDYHTQIRKVMP